MLAKRFVLSFVLLLLPAAALRAQTIDDAVMMPKKSLCTGFEYSNDRWDRYWEGPLKRTNGNIGTITTEAVTWMGTYGISDKLNLIAMLPYISTRASAGVLHGQNGLQDVTIAAKYRLFYRELSHGDALRAFVAASAGLPTHGYTPDFQPLSLGSASNRSSGRFTLNYQRKQGWFLGATAAYTARGNVTLDRSFYFTNGQAVASNHVDMPDVFDYSLTVGYHNHGLLAPLSFIQQNTQGGGDIRRQDVPFVSNRMDYSKIEGSLLYALPVPRNLSVKLAAAHVLSGRNVGQSTTFSGGLLYTFHF
jgi:hypothetical protein